MNQGIRILFILSVMLFASSCSSKGKSETPKPSAEIESKPDKAKDVELSSIEETKKNLAAGDYRFISPETYDREKPPVFHLVRGKYLVPNLDTLVKQGDPNRYTVRSWLSEDKRFRVEKIELFSGFGIKKGQVVQYVNFDTNTLHSYEFKDTINLRMIEADVGYVKYGEIWILLDDSFDGNDEEVISSNEGVAYNGNDFKLKASKNEATKYHESKNPEALVIFKGYQEFAKDKSTLKETFETTVMNKQVYGYSVENPPPMGSPYSESAEGAAIKLTENTILLLDSLPWHGGDYNHPDKKFKYGNFIEGADMTIIQDGTGMGECGSLYIVKGEEVIKHELQCNAGGC